LSIQENPVRAALPVPYNGPGSANMRHHHGNSSIFSYSVSFVPGTQQSFVSSRPMAWEIRQGRRWTSGRGVNGTTEARCPDGTKSGRNWKGFSSSPSLEMEVDMAVFFHFF